MGSITLLGIFSKNGVIYYRMSRIPRSEPAVEFPRSDRKKLTIEVSIGGTPTLMIDQIVAHLESVDSNYLNIDPNEAARRFIEDTFSQPWARADHAVLVSRSEAYRDRADNVWVADIFAGDADLGVEALSTSMEAIKTMLKPGGEAVIADTEIDLPEVETNAQGDVELAYDDEGFELIRDYWEKRAKIYKQAAESIGFEFEMIDFMSTDHPYVSSLRELNRLGLAVRLTRTA